MRPIASEWGICQRNMIANRIHGSAPSVPRAAAQPATGGSAPGTAPTREHSEVTGLSGSSGRGEGAAVPAVTMDAAPLVVAGRAGVAPVVRGSDAAVHAGQQG